LWAANLLGSVVNSILEPFHLAAAVDCLALTAMCVLVHDQYDGASISVHKRTSSDNTDIDDAVIGNALDIHCAVGTNADNSYIVSCDASVGATVNQCTMLVGWCGRGLVCDLSVCVGCVCNTMHFDGISVSINNHHGWWFPGVRCGHHAGDIARMLFVLLVGGK
jgi:hypothetical protein